MGTYLMEAAEETLLDAFQISFNSVEIKLKNTSFCYVKTFLTDFALTGILDYIIDRNVKKWAQSSFLMDVFTRRAL